MAQWVQEKSRIQQNTRDFGDNLIENCFALMPKWVYLWHKTAKLKHTTTALPMVASKAEVV